jgi:hypothetical protein
MLKGQRQILYGKSLCFACFSLISHRDIRMLCVAGIFQLNIDAQNKKVVLMRVYQGGVSVPVIPWKFSLCSLQRFQHVPYDFFGFVLVSPLTRYVLFPGNTWRPSLIPFSIQYLRLKLLVTTHSKLCFLKHLGYRLGSQHAFYYPQFHKFWRHNLLDLVQNVMTIPL